MKISFKPVGYLFFCCLGLALLLVGCTNSQLKSKRLGCRKPFGLIYRADVYQGNYITPEEVQNLKTGLNRQQVVDVMGSPLIKDPFHAQRWDYVYQLRHCSGSVEERRVTVYFDNDIVSRFEDFQIPTKDPLLIPGLRTLEITKN